MGSAAWDCWTAIHRQLKPADAPARCGLVVCEYFAIGNTQNFVIFRLSSPSRTQRYRFLLFCQILRRYSSFHFNYNLLLVPCLLITPTFPVFSCLPTTFLHPHQPTVPVPLRICMPPILYISLFARDAVLRRGSILIALLVTWRAALAASAPVTRI